MTLRCTIYHVAARSAARHLWTTRLHKAMDWARCVDGGAIVIEYEIRAEDLGELLVCALMGASLPGCTRVMGVVGDASIEADTKRARLRVVKEG